LRATLLRSVSARTLELSASRTSSSLPNSPATSALNSHMEVRVLSVANLNMGIRRRSCLGSELEGFGCDSAFVLPRPIFIVARKEDSKFNICVLCKFLSCPMIIDMFDSIPDHLAHELPCLEAC
jgi:hypothetical protein